MVLRNVLRVCVVLLCGMTIQSCKARGTVKPLSQAHSLAPSGYLTLDLVSGLMASPGSPERIRAGRIFAELVNERIRGYRILHAAEKVDEDFERGLRYTVDYLLTPREQVLADGKVCPAEARVRVFRGIAGQPVIRRRGAKTGLHLMKGYGKQLGAFFGDLKVSGLLPDDFLRADIGKDPSEGNWLQGVSAGELIHEHLEKIYDESTSSRVETLRESAMAARWEKFDWEHSTLGFQWIKPMLNHTLGQQSRTGPDLSASSFFISTSLSPDVAKGFGDGAVLVADVCPERLMLTQMTETIYELEILVPFFLLPEEIVRTEFGECTFHLDPLAKVRCEVDRNAEYPEELPESCTRYSPFIKYCEEQRKVTDITRGEKPTPLARKLESLYTNDFTIPPVPEFNSTLYGGNKDFKYDKKVVSDAVFLHHVKAFNEFWRRSPSKQEFRAHLMSGPFGAATCEVEEVQKKALTARAAEARRDSASELETARFWQSQGNKPREEKNRQASATFLKVADYLKGLSEKIKGCSGEVRQGT